MVTFYWPVYQPHTKTVSSGVYVVKGSILWPLIVMRMGITTPELKENTAQALYADEACRFKQPACTRTCKT
jgi:hypothetical protein